MLGCSLLKRLRVSTCSGTKPMVRRTCNARRSFTGPRWQFFSWAAPTQDQWLYSPLFKLFHDTPNLIHYLIWFVLCILTFISLMWPVAWRSLFDFLRYTTISSSIKSNIAWTFHSYLILATCKDVHFEKYI